MLYAGTTEKVVAVMLGKAFRFAQIHFVAALLPQADAHNLQLKRNPSYAQLQQIASKAI